MKYWNKARIKRVRERRAGRDEARYKMAAQTHRNAAIAKRTRTPGNMVKNSALIFEALGIPIRRAMVERLRTKGAMSLSKLSEPFRITLPTAQTHILILERSGLVKTHKQGRARICSYNPAAIKELADWIKSL
jgi:DNA-binding transcriptional ArsR family regulator